MDRLRGFLRVENFNGKESEDCLMWNLRVMSVLKSKGIVGMVVVFEILPDRLDEDWY